MNLNELKALLAELEDKAERLEWEDDYCYTNGKMAALRQQIARVEMEINGREG